MRSNLFQYRYRVLAEMGLFFALTAYAWRGYWMIDAFAANVAAGFISALIIVALVDRAAEQREEERRARIEKVALRLARAPLYYLAEIFRDMIKASLAELPCVPRTWRRLFEKTLTDQLDWIDLSGRPGSLEDQDWYSYLSRVVPKLSTDLSEVIDKYAASVGIGFVEQIEALRQDTFLLLLCKLAHTRRYLSTQGRDLHCGLTDVSAIRESFFEKLVGVIEYHDAHAAEPLTPPGEEFVRNDISPAVGSSRLKERPQTPTFTVVAGLPPEMTPPERVSELAHPTGNRREH
jgi:hypothetical protein